MLKKLLPKKPSLTKNPAGADPKGAYRLGDKSQAENRSWEAFGGMRQIDFDQNPPQGRAKLGFDFRLLALLSLLLHGALVGLIGLFFLQQPPAPLMVDLLDLPSEVDLPPKDPEQPLKEAEKVITRDTPLKEPPPKISEKDQAKTEQPPNPDQAAGGSPAATPAPANKQPPSKPPTEQNKNSSLLRENQPGFDPASRFLKQPTEVEVPEAVPIPAELTKILAKQGLKNTDNDRLSYALSDYSWSYKTYIEQWGRKIIEWWRPPTDYISGLVPKGGKVWIKAEISRQGKLLQFKVYKSGITTEMQRKALEALISSFEIPPLPADFPEKIDFYWQFIYPDFDTLVQKKNDKLE